MMKVETLTILIYLLKYVNSQGCSLPNTPDFTGDLIRIRINEVDLQGTLNANPQDYRGFIGFTAPESSVTLTLYQKDAPSLPERLDPADYFTLQYFNSEPNTGITGFFIQLTRSVDRDGLLPDASDDINSVEYQITCYENSNPNFKLYYLVRIIFDDLNDNTPLFTQDLFSGTVNELTPIGTTVFQSLSYTDLDEGAFGRGNFAILPGDGSEFDGSTKFEIQTSGTGEVSVKNVLDFEVLNAASRLVYNLNISISDGGVPSRVSYTTLSLTITDGDDLPPEFVYESCIIDSGVCFNPLYRTSITSQLTTGQLTMYPIPTAAGDASTLIQARDQDSDLSHSIQFSVIYTEPQGYENRFSVQTTGPFANPAGTPSYKSQLYRAQISLNTAIDRNDPVIQAADSQLKVIIKAQEQTSNKRFENAMILIDIRPTGGDPVLGGNLSPPFTGYIMENAGVGSFVVGQTLTEPMKLLITDDSGQVQNDDYVISMVPGNGIFTIDGDGYIKLSNYSLDTEVKQYYDFNVTLKDKTDGSHKDMASIRILIVDVNDNFPVFNLHSESILSYTVPAGDYTNPRLIANVSASDLDVSYSNNKVAYQSQSEPNLPNKVYVDDDGIVYFKGSASVGEVYTIYITASDNGTPSNSAVIVITLQVTGCGCSGSTDLSISYRLLIFITISNIIMWKRQML